MSLPHLGRREGTASCVGVAAVELLARLFERGGDDQAFLGPGHRHIEHPQLLRQHRPLALKPHRLERDGGKLFFLHLVAADTGEAQLRMQDGGGVQIVAVKAVPAPRVGQKDDRPLKALGAVDAGNRDRVAPFPHIGGGKLLSAFGEPVDHPQKHGEPPEASLVVIPGDLGQPGQVGKSLLSARHRPAEQVEAGAGVDFGNQLRGAHRQGAAAQGLEGFEKLRRMPALLRGFGEGGKEGDFAPDQTDRGDFVISKSEEGREHRADQLDVEGGVAQRPQKAEHRRDLAGGQESSLRPGECLDSLFVKRLPEQLGPAARGAQQHRDIPGHERAQRPAVADHRVSIKQGADFSGHCFRLGGQRPVRRKPTCLEQQHPHPGIPVRRKVRHRLKPVVLIVNQFADPAAHQRLEDTVDRAGDLLPAAEISSQSNQLGRSGKIAGTAAVPLAAAQKNLRLRLPEPVDALLDIPDEEEVAAV